MSSEEIAEHAQAIATETIQVQQVADRYLARIAEHRQTVNDSLATAKEAGDGRTVAALVGVDLKGLELDARLTNRLDAPGGPSVSITINVPAGCKVAAQAPAVGDIIDIE